ncbi:MAG: response regulator [candidate division Zixibacteria bacterium]|nr:response regulator [candidate division Zixibacteria bacterium]
MSNLKEIDGLTQLHEIAQSLGRPLRGLIIDDEANVAETFRTVCEISEDLNVDIAASSAEALRALNLREYDFATVDIVMPEVSGLETIRIIRDRFPKVSILVITGNATEKLKREACSEGILRLLEKPLEIAEFLGALGESLKTEFRKE